MVSMSLISLLLLMLVAACYCAPANLLDIGGTLGYESRMNGTIGGHLKGERDGLSVSGNGRGIIGTSWEPTLIARGHAQALGATVVGDASLKTVIDNSWQPGFQGELGRTSKGKWVAGFQPDSYLNNRFLITPNVQLKTGDDAKKLMGLPVASENVTPQQVPYGQAYMPYYAPSYNPYMASNGNVDPNQYAAYLAYAQALAQMQASNLGADPAKQTVVQQ